MTTKELIHSNNGTPYFEIRIRMIDSESYDKVTAYLGQEAKTIQAGEEDALKGKMIYVFDKEGKQIVRTSANKRIIELTKDVKSEIRSKIEKIIAGY